MSADFRSSLLDWFRTSQRDLPWRESRDPYRVWVSEIMLQQTVVKAVIPYYEKWMIAFPTVEALASAPLETVLAHWQGLGYYSRCRNLHEGALSIAANGMPFSYEEWLKIKGVGEYTAGAIASIAHDEHIAAVDGNVERVFARVQADDSSGPKLKAAAKAWSTKQLPEENVGEWTQALMELGALVCRPKGALCDQCPVAASCLAHRNGLVESLPTPKPRTKWKQIKETLWVVKNGEQIALRTAEEGEWWTGLQVLPRGLDLGGSQLQGDIKYTVTTHKIAAQVVLLESTELPEGCSWFGVEQLAKAALPAPDRKALALIQQ